jgi:hypothetical protein
MTIVNLAVSSFATTGTISGGALNTLTVANASGLAVNDYIIIEIGGEPGAGLRGTMDGVGGVWPNVSYANSTAMLADTSKPAGTYAYLISNGDVYRWWDTYGTGIAWQHQVGTAGGYYVQKVIPRALRTKITAKAGTTLTLQTAATNPTTNANVYFDNTGIIQAVFGLGSGVADGSEIVFPSGRFAISEQCATHGHHGWNIHGTSKTATTIFYPKGISGASVLGSSQCNNMWFHDFGIEGNARANGYMNYSYPGDTTQQVIYNNGVQLTTSFNGIVSDIKGVDCYKTISFDGASNGSIAERIECILNDGIWVEIWHMSGNDSTGITFRDITVTSPTWMSGIEFFRCDNSTMTRVTGTNTFFAMNTCNDFLLENITLTVNGAQQGANSIFASNSQVVDINKNIDGIDVSDGGLIRNLVVTQSGTTPPNNDTLRGVAIAPACIKVRVHNATFTLPNYVPGSTTNGATGLLSDAPDTELVLVTCHGTTNPQWPAGGGSSYANVNLSGGTYRCVTTDTGVKGGTQLPCRSFTVHCV